MLMWKRILGKDIRDLNTDDLLNIHSFNRAMKEVIDNKTESFRWELEKALEANPGGQEDDNRQQGKWKKDTDSQATLPRENSQGERNGENNHNKKHRDSNPGRQEHDNPQQGKWKKKNPDSLSTAPRENRKGERNGENNHNKKHRDSNPGRQEYDNPQQGKWKKNRDSQRENSQGERNGENNHNKNHRDSNPGGQEHDNRQQRKWKNKNPDSSSTAPRENRKGERNGERRLTESNRTPHQNANTTENNLTSGKTTQSIQQVTRSEALNVLDMDQNSWSATVNINPITTLGENIKQKLQRNKRYIVPTLMVLLSLALWSSLNSWKKKNPKKVTTEQKDSIKRDSGKRDSGKRDWESETIDKEAATGELSHFVKEGESMYSIVTNLKSSWKLSGISSVREDIIRVACEKGFIMKIKKGQTTKEKFDPRDLSPGDVIVIKIKEFEDLHRQ